MKGLLSLAPFGDAVVIVDVLSFSTEVDVGVSNGASVFPYQLRRPQARIAWLAGCQLFPPVNRTPAR
jgi:hypothetical protein